MRISKRISKKPHNWKIILLFLVAASTLAVKINYFTPGKFQAVTQVKLKEKICDNHPGKLKRIKNNPLSKAVFYDAVLKNAVIDGIKDKNLNVTYFQTGPLFRTELYHSSPIMVTYLLKNENFYKQKFNFKYAFENNFVLSYEMNGVMRERAGEFGKEIHETDFKFTVNKNPKIHPAKEEILLEQNLQFTISSDEAMADNLLKSSIDISSAENGTTTISVTSGIPEKSMLLANSISESLLAKTNTSGALAVINQQLEKITGELEKARNEITGKRTVNETVHQAGQAGTYSRTYASFENLEAQKKNLEFQSIVLENLSDTLRKNRNNYNSTTDYGSINDPLIIEYLTALNEKITKKKNAADEDASKLTEEINALQNTVADVVRNTRKKIALQQDRIYALMATADHGFSVPATKENNIPASNQNLYLTEKLYNYIADKKTEIQGSMLFTAGSFVQKATLPRRPCNANTTVIWILALMFGLITGSIAVLILNRFLKPGVAGKAITEDQNSISYFASVENGNKKDTSAQFRDLCTKTLLLRQAGEKQIITVTSDASGEGKSFVATHFAKSLASLDLNVLVIDMNLQAPSVEENFETKSNYTFADVLQKRVGIQEAVQITSIPGLDILTAGNLPHGINSLVATNNISKILNELKEHYDAVIIDASDTTSSTNAMPCMKFSNSTFYIVKEGADEKIVLEKTEQIKTDLNIEKIFFILNKVKHPGKQKHRKTAHQSEEKDQRGMPAQTSFLKKVALWFY
jgi:tyrosine-protein kinase Etk/Wzc